MEWSELVGSRWQGKCELWEDPLGDVAQTSECSVAVDANALTYTWSYKGKPHQGRLELSADGAEFVDSWHQEKPIKGERLPSGAIATVRYTYMEEWGWRINLCHRTPSDELVLQMTNIAPWGEEARAVRMVCQRAPGPA
ncbi:MAG TPA: hypothetical protein PKA88_06020 [Polyangiaceae bacterium]|nr:hypothetical protein [Polyangiaceae bacterium]HMR81035.1 hypothetical protein [Polyangiaceae bacterium]